jgi:LacI family transcriptional regulator
VSFGPAYSTNVDHVGVDLYGGSLQAVRHLFEIGCRRVAYAGHERDLRNGDPRYDAYVQVVAENRATLELIPLDHGYYADSYCGIKAYLSENTAPEGLFCWNDEAAIGANRACADLNLNVCRDVAIIGSDGIREVGYSVPALSTVAQPFEEMCSTAWTFLLNRLQDPTLARQGAVLPMRLERRASTIGLHEAPIERLLITKGN